MRTSGIRDDDRRQPGRAGDEAAAAHHGIGAPAAQRSPAAAGTASAARADRRGGAQRVAAVDAADREEVDLVAGRRDQLGLDPLARAEEGDLGAPSPKLVGDRHGRHDVAGGPPGRYDDSWHRSLALLPRAGERPPSTTRSLPARARLAGFAAGFAAAVPPRATLRISPTATG